MKISTALQNCTSLDQAIKVINETTSQYDSHELAAQYAYDATQYRDKDNRADTNEFLFHLDYLTNAGANFDSDKAKNFAKEYLI